VGVASSSSSLVISYFTPTAEGWGKGDHTVNCILGTDPPTRMTVSMKGSQH
jgi:hypothetical protein